LRTKTLPSTDAYARLRGAHASLEREFSAALLESHGLTSNDYSCLLLLSRADDEGMRRIDIANELQLSPSGITRLLERLMSQGLVGKGECAEDARVSYAILTDAGRDKLKQAAPGYVDEIERRLTTVLSDEEIQTLTELLGRFTEAAEDCTPDE
jgi:DNA-binding MarR family transcriptional regulator